MRKGFWLLDALQPVVLAAAVVMMVYLLLLQPHKVDGNSMYPNFYNRENIFTDKISYRRGHPKRGDVVVFHAPPPHNDDYIKRIIGLPGETIMLQDGRVYLNGRLLPEIYLPPSFVTAEKSFLRNRVPYKIPTGYYIVLGDNRGASSDSREFGPISEKAIVGKAFFVYWPVGEHFGLIPKPTYPATPL